MKLGRRNSKAAAMSTMESCQEEMSLFPMLRSSSSNKQKSTTDSALVDPSPATDDCSSRDIASPLALFRFGSRLEQEAATDKAGSVGADKGASLTRSEEISSKSTAGYTSIFKWKSKDIDVAVDETRQQDEPQQRKEARLRIFQRSKAKVECDNGDEAAVTKNGIVKLFKRKGQRGGPNNDDLSSATAITGQKRAFLFQRSGKNMKVEEENDERDGAPVDNEDEKRVQIRAVYKSFGQEAEKLLKVEEIPLELESHNDVLIKVQASTVSLNDCLLRRGFDFSLLSPASLPVTPGIDCIGTISRVGDAVSDFAVGDRVAALVRTGGNARYISVPASSLVKIDKSLDSGDAVSMVSIYSTAYQCLKAIASQGGPMYSLQNKKVLVLGGMDGTGRALTQMCKKARAEIYFCAPTHRHLYVKNIMGVNPLPETDWLPQVEGQLDFVFDGICDDGSRAACRALKPDGELVRYGKSALLREKEMGLFGPPMAEHWNNLCNAWSSRVHSVDVWDLFRSDPESFKDDLKILFQQLKHSKMTPHIAKRVSLTGVGEAQAKLESGEIRGTVVCFPWRSMRAAKIEHHPMSEDEKL